GKGSLTAGGDIGGAGVASQVFLMGAGGDAARQGANAKLVAGGSIVLNTIDNPSSLVQKPSIGKGPSFNGRTVLPILSYSADSAVALAALGGDIRIGNAPAAAAVLDTNSGTDILSDQASYSGGVAILPPKTAFTAFNGSIAYTGDPGGAQVLYPSPAGSLKLLAGQDITGLSMTVSDADASQFAVANISKQNTTFYTSILSGGNIASGAVLHDPSTDVFVNDVVALGGSIKDVTFTFPARARIWAAQDIANPLLSLQNLDAGDVSEVVAQQGSVRITQPQGWGISGPGALLVQAGQNIDLGIAALSSFGNLRNPSIASSAGASIDLVAGYSGSVDLALLDGTFTSLITTGGSKNKDAAKAAVDALLDPKKVGTGSINSFNTSIQSDAGGSINLLAPGGNITVGLPTENTNRLIGVVTNAGGAIRSYLSGDFDINQGKVLTAQGGDILIYTSGGSIDAGRGAKTSVTTPPPTRTPVLNDKGVITGYTYSVPVAVAGSGIQTATSKPGGPESVAPPSGNIYLFAPAGTIDAGEAGIASGGAIFIAALTVLNADNISAVGTSSGVPVTPPGSVASTVAAAGGTTVTSDSKASDAANQAAAAAAAAGITNFRPAILTVEVMGFGDRNCKETDKDCFAK
ncbi:MAG: filamentous hemagglutinin family protein, partial [Pseudomonadota bacterium]|nr:filamentous hemagglutinin family protein [Pseudomonadota bacterium]